jgi:hypothetical protein
MSNDREFNHWEWECFEKWITKESFGVTDSGPLAGSVTEFLIRRDQNLNLILETTSFNAPNQSSTIHPETVFIPIDQVKFENPSLGYSATAYGVIRKSRSDDYSLLETKGVIANEISSVIALEGLLSNENPEYIIEWLENIGGSFIWPHSFSDQTMGETRRIFHSPTGEIVLISRTGGEEFPQRWCYHCCARISIEGTELFIGSFHGLKANHVKKPGFILYKGNPSNEIRSKIRDCLAFSLGTFLIYLGFTSFDANWTPVSFRSESAEAINNNDIRNLSRLPGPLGNRFEWEINPEQLQKVVVGLYSKYDTYQLQSAFWSYWHAVAAPVHMTAAHFGAAIEALQNTYIKNHRTSFKTTILDEPLWNTIYGKIIEFISTSNILGEDKQIFLNKLQNFNRAPQSILMSRFLDYIGIQIGEVEKSAWNNRNRGAHGGPVNIDNAIKVIRENKALMVLMNRIILAITNGNAQYYDYYSIGRPTRILRDTIPNESPR